MVETRHKEESKEKLEEKTYKPVVTTEWFILLPGVLLFFLIIPLFFFGFIFVMAALQKWITTYKITNENELVIESSFLSTTRRVIRIDQITSVSLKQGLMDKLFGTGTIEFGVFGKSGMSLQQSSKNKSMNIQKDAFMSIKEYDEVFKKLSKITGSEYGDEIEVERPSVKAAVVANLFGLFFGLFVLLGVGFVFYSVLGAELGGNMLMGVLILIAVFILFLSLLSLIISILKIKRTKYIVGSIGVARMHNYFFSKKVDSIGYLKITNIEKTRNAFSYALFKVGGVSLFTGGSHDPSLPGMTNHDEFYQKLSLAYNAAKGGDTYVSREDIMKQKVEKPGMSTAPGGGFIVKKLLNATIVCVILGVVAFIYEPLGLIAVFLLYLLMIIPSLLVWKNTFYEFYDDKIVVTSGVINIKRSEVNLRNLKHIEMARPFLFDKVLNQGSVFIYTAGSGSGDHYLYSVSEYKQIYDALKNYLKHDL